MTAREIYEAARKLVEDICVYCEAQANVWRIVPQLALEADGRSGYDDNLARAYRNRQWPLECSKKGAGYWIYVNLSTGKLEYAIDLEGPHVDLHVRYQDVLKLAFNMEEIDAGSIVRSLIERAQQKTTCAPHPEGPDWRDKLKTELALVK